MSDTPPVEEVVRPPPTYADEPRCGRMIVELIDNGTSRPIPYITFDPVGRFTPGLIYDYITHFGREIERAHAATRHAAAAAAVSPPSRKRT